VAGVGSGPPKPVALFARKGTDCLGKHAGDAELHLRMLFDMVRGAWGGGGGGRGEWAEIWAFCASPKQPYKQTNWDVCQCEQLVQAECALC
jgi:hypothetical protein